MLYALSHQMKYFGHPDTCLSSLDGSAQPLSGCMGIRLRMLAYRQRRRTYPIDRKPRFQSAFPVIYRNQRPGLTLCAIGLIGLGVMSFLDREYAQRSQATSP